MNEGNDVLDKKEELNLWMSIWTKPREAVRYAIDQKSMKFAIILALIAGVFNMLNGASSNNLGDTMSIPYIFVLAFVVGPTLGWISWWISAGLAKMVGTWLGGTGRFVELKMAFAVSYIPLILVGVLWIPDLLILGKMLFVENFYISLGQQIWLFVSGIINIVVGVWIFVITIMAIAEAHRFSAWRGFWTIVIPSVFVITVLLLLFLPFIIFLP